MTEPPSRGLFITFEGPDGSGKSTQLRLLAARLRAEGRDVLESAEPGGTSIGRQIRRILLDPANSEIGAGTELLLMFAARAQNVDEWIVPALQAGRIVLSDRFTDSSLVYQGVARSLGVETVLMLDRIACHGLKPDLTFLIDVDAEAGLSRAHARNAAINAAEADESRLDRHALEFHRKVRDAYLELAAREPERIRVIDGTGTPEQVAAQVWAEAMRFLAQGARSHAG